MWDSVAEGLRATSRDEVFLPADEGSASDLDEDVAHVQAVLLRGAFGMPQEAGVPTGVAERECLGFLTAASAAWYVLLCCVVLGAGMGWVNAPVTNNAVVGMPRARAGTAPGIASTSRQVGSSLGVAVTGSVLAAGLHGPLATGFAAGLVDRGGDGGTPPGRRDGRAARGR
jgi:hypothetical protein